MLYFVSLFIIIIYIYFTNHWPMSVSSVTVSPKLTNGMMKKVTVGGVVEHIALSLQLYPYC